MIPYHGFSNPQSKDALGKTYQISANTKTHTAKQAIGDIPIDFIFSTVDGDNFQLIQQILVWYCEK